MDSFRALRVHKNTDGTVRAALQALTLDDLSPGEVVIRSRYSSVNYKDALAATGNGRILRRFPLVAGVDVAGEVSASVDGRFREGDQVLVTGCGLGESHDGGFSEVVRVPADWVVPLPPGMTLFDAMMLGTAGFTAALAIDRMEQNGLVAAQGQVVVSGASGGVGSVAIDLLSGRGYEVVALSRKLQVTDYLQSLGAAEVLDAKVAAASGKPLETARWAGAIDNVGGTVLEWLIRTVQPWGSIASIGLAGGAELHTTVMPFILRGVSILGITSANCPMQRRLKVWQRLVTDLQPQHLASIVAGQVTLDELPAVFETLLSGEHHGRYIVDLQ
ncbi:MAG: YhdH/YhfP family quinone oxidoreductase [Gammaproteobacteria bacterium]|nr:YhdH/YhfP family quinone oxidoreductase [Gammaproteobacteria bacterium]